MLNIPSDIPFMSVAELGARYRDRSLSPVEVAKAYLARIATFDGQLDAYVTVTEQRALADAQRAEAELRRGEDRGPMHGIPYSLKDIVETEGIRTTGQSRSMADHVPATDATVEVNLRAGGAVLLGKNTTWEFAHGGPSWDIFAPPARNPWNTDRHPSASSSGTAAAIAAGLSAAGIGTDTGGSIRAPAAVCGVAGLKPTYGRVSRKGILPNSFTHDHVGPMARSSRDVALMLAVVARYDPGDPGSLNEPVADYEAALTGDLRGLRIGIPYDWFEQGRPPSAGTMAAFAEALTVFREAGTEIVPVTLPGLLDFENSKKIMGMCELYSIYGRTLRETPELLGESLRYRIQCGALIRAEDYIQASRWRTRLAAATHRVFADVDLILTPTGEPAGRLEPLPHSYTFAHAGFTSPFNTSGNPALTVLSGFDEDGMPYGLQIAGRVLDEATVLRAGDAFERRTQWHLRRPPGFGGKELSGSD